jgi:hypothetical protein
MVHATPGGASSVETADPDGVSLWFAGPNRFAIRSPVAT